jgi:hypothetical protein
MTKLTKGTVAFHGLIPSLAGAIQAWQPQPLESEVQYRDSLVAFLRETVPDDCRVEREYRHAGTTADVYVSWNGMLSRTEVFLELKLNLKRKAAYDRLVGQVEALDPGKRKVIVVLIGASDAGLVGRLREQYARSIETDLGEEPSLAIVSIV